MPPQQTVNIPRKHSLDTTSIWVLMGTLILSVFMFIPFVAVPFVATKTYILAAGVLLTLAIYILARLSRGNAMFPPLLLVGALWLPVIAYTLSAIFSGVQFNNAFWGTSLETDTLGFMLVVASLGTLTAFILRKSEHYQVFLKAAAVTFGAVAILQIITLFVSQFVPDKISPTFSIIGSFDDLAFLLGLGVIGVLVTLRFLDVTGRMRHALIISGVAAIILLVIANSSLVWILVALVSLGLFVESIMRRVPRTTDVDLEEITRNGELLSEEREGAHSPVMPLIILAISVFFIIGGTLGNAFADLLDVEILSVRPSWESTLNVMREVYSVSPVFGTGPGTFGIEWLKYRDASLNETVFWNIDFTSGIGFVPTSFVTTGILGALAWIALFALFIVFGVRMLILRAPEDAFIRYVAIISFIATIYLFIIAVFGLPSSVILALAFVFAGLFASTMRFAEGGKQWSIVFSRSPKIGFVIVFSLTLLLLASVVASYTLVVRYLATSKISVASNEFLSGNLDAAGTAAQNSISFVPTAIAYQIQASVANARLNQIITSTTMTATEAQQAFQTAMSAGIDAALTATSMSPSNYQNWLALGNLYAQAVPLRVTDAFESARTAYERALELNPTNPQIQYILAQLNIANNDINTAREHLEAAIALKQNYTDAIFLLSQLEVQDGNLEEALDAALDAAFFTPNNPNILFHVGILYAAKNDLTNAAAALSAAVDANPQFANARYFLSAVYANLGDFPRALAEMRAIAAMSNENANAVTQQLSELEDGRNPFPDDLLSISPAPPIQQ